MLKTPLRSSSFDLGIVNSKQKDHLLSNKYIKKEGMAGLKDGSKTSDIMAKSYWDTTHLIVWKKIED